MVRVPKELNAPGINNTSLRTFADWFSDKYPSKYSRKSKRFKFYLKWYVGYLFFAHIGPAYHHFVSKITAYYPFSLLYKDRLIHADNIKARDLMRGMEAIAESNGIPVCINDGYWDRQLSVFYGKLIKRGVAKQDAVQKLQQLFQDKYGTVYVQDEKRGFRVLVDTNLL